MKDYKYPILWLVFISYLFLCHSSDLPESDTLFSKMQDIWKYFFKTNLPLRAFLESNMDKLVHVFFFFILSYLLGISLYKQKERIKWKNRYIFFSFIICLFYGILIEILQCLFLPDRSADAMDLAADAIGSVMGIIFLHFYL